MKTLPAKFPEVAGLGKAFNQRYAFLGSTEVEVQRGQPLHRRRREFSVIDLFYSMYIFQLGTTTAMKLRPQNGCPHLGVRQPER